MLRKISLALFLLLLSAAPPAGDEDCLTCPQVELERDGKPIVAVKTSPDEVSDVFVIEYLDVQVGPLQNRNDEARVLTVGDIDMWWNDASQLEPNIPPGEFVWAVYNPDLSDNSNRVYLLELKLTEATKPAHYEMQRFVIYDPEPYNTLVKFGADAHAYGHLALVERVKGVFEKITLGSGKAAYVENDDRFITTFADKKDAVNIVQGKSRASGKRLDYDNNGGNAILAGPITLERSGKKPLDGSADRLIYNVDSETIILIGKVILKQDSRITKAESALLLESTGYAYLYGDPVISEGNDGVLRGLQVRYNLNSGELVVLKGVAAVFEDK